MLCRMSANCPSTRKQDAAACECLGFSMSKKPIPVFTFPTIYFTISLLHYLSIQQPGALATFDLGLDQFFPYWLFLQRSFLFHHDFIHVHEFTMLQAPGSSTASQCASRKLNNASLLFNCPVSCFASCQCLLLLKIPLPTRRTMSTLPIERRIFWSSKYR